MESNRDYLRPVDDGLPMRVSQDYARYKLRALELYIQITNHAMRDKWQNRAFIDLQAGPGKNRIGSDIVLGSPLIAVTAPHAANRFYFNEMDMSLANALLMRVSGVGGATVLSQDMNTVVHNLSREVKSNRPTSLNIAFMDPEGLELSWETVASVAQIPRTDLIINFSSQGVLRNHGAGNYQVIDSFFGSTEWKVVFDRNRSQPRRALIDFYLDRLKAFGYRTDVDPDLPPAEIVAKNSRNSEIYSIIFASKHDLGAKFWRQAEKYTNPPRLL